MRFVPRRYQFLLLLATGLTPLSALAQPAPLHTMDMSPVARFLDASTTTPLTNAAPTAAGTLPASAATASASLHDAGSVATDVVATIGTCDGYFTKSQLLSASLQPAFEAMAAKDLTRAAATLPLIESLLADLPASEIKPEVCDGNHINAYTAYQFFTLNALRASGVDTGFPTSLPIVKQPDLTQSALPYAVGWIKFEQKDFNGALTAYGKGLALYPHDHALESEYMATLVELGNGQAIVDYADKLLTNTFDYTDEERSKLYVARGLGSLALGKAQDCDQAFSVALRYHYSEELASMEARVRALLGGAK